VTSPAVYFLQVIDKRLAEQGLNVDWYDYWLNGH